MDFSSTETQRELAALTREILERSSDTLWADLVKAGVLPESADDFGLLEQCSILVELGRAVASVPYLPTITAFSALSEFGTPSQQKWLTPGTVLSVALAEELGDEPASVAERVADGWRLTGTKTTVPHASSAEAFLVSARTPDGPAVFLLTSDEVTLEQQHLVDEGDAAIVSFDVRVDDDRLVPVDVAWLTARYTVGLCAVQLGVTERALEITSEYAKTRVQFERPIGTFQAVGQRLADAFIDVAAIRLTLWQAAWRLSEGLPADTEVATAKFWAADAGHRVAHTAVHVHGGTGIDVSHTVHRYFTAAKRYEFELGGATTQLRRIGATFA